MMGWIIVILTTTGATCSVLGLINSVKLKQETSKLWWSASAASYASALVIKIVLS